MELHDGELPTVAAGGMFEWMWLPLLHPLHASASNDHLWLWAVAGAGVGLAVVIGARVITDFFRDDDEESPLED